MKRYFLFIITALVILGTGGLLAAFKARQRLGHPGVKVVARDVLDPKGNVIGTNCIDLPAHVLDYSSEVLPVDSTVLGWLPKDTTYGQRAYKAADGFQMAMSAVLMGADRTSIHKPEYCLQGQGWTVDAAKSEVTTVPIAQPHAYELPVSKWIGMRQLRNEAGREIPVRSVFVFWLVAEDRIEPYHNRIMGSIVRHMIKTGELQRWAYVTCFATCLPGQEDAVFARMRTFLSAAVPQFQLTTLGGPSRAAGMASLPK